MKPVSQMPSQSRSSSSRRSWARWIRELSDRALVRDDAGVRRVAIVGPGGAGKSTFAEELARRTGLPVVHLDQHYWRPGWARSLRNEWEGLQAELVAGDRWIIDGNYGGTFDLRFERADTVVVLQLPAVICVAGALRRSLVHRGTAVQAAGCPERVDADFLRWIWRYRHDSRPRLDVALHRHRGHLAVVDLRSRRQANDLVRCPPASDP